MPGKEWIIPKKRWNRREILLVFARAPERGRVKTRLAKDLGPDKALDLYQCFVAKTLAAAGEWAENRESGSAGREIRICYTPAGGDALVRGWLDREDAFFAQAEGDLGRRMASAMAEAFESGGGKVILVGTDIPDLTASHLEAAGAALDQASLVWGPSLDGGYWLVGASGPESIQSVFHDIPWGTDRVLSTSLDRCRAANLTWRVLAPLRDVDTLSDLKATEFYKTLRSISLQ